MQKWVVLALLLVSTPAYADSLTGIWYSRGQCNGSVLNLMPEGKFRFLYFEQRQLSDQVIEIVEGRYDKATPNLLLRPDSEPNLFHWGNLEFGLLVDDSRQFFPSSTLPRQTILRTISELGRLSFFARADCVHPILMNMPDFKK